MGRLHAEKVARLRDEGAGVLLHGVADLDLSLARDLASALGAEAATDFHSLLERTDAAIVAVPTVDHFKVVSEALRAGCDVLVEKPIAASLNEARELMDLAAAGRRMLQVGHLEWFNSAMVGIRGRIRRPRFVEARRVGSFPDRAIDIDVVRDLMIHDLDILQQLLGEEPDRIEAFGLSVLSDSIDFASARLRYPSGCLASLTASRLSQSATRRISFFEREASYSVDFLAPSVRIVQRVRGVSGSVPRFRIEDLELDQGDALLAQLRSFLNMVRDRKPPARIGVGTGDEALGALRTALRVLEAMPAAEEIG